MYALWLTFTLLCYFIFTSDRIWHEAMTSIITCRPFFGTIWLRVCLMSVDNQKLLTHYFIDMKHFRDCYEILLSSLVWYINILSSSASIWSITWVIRNNQLFALIRIAKIALCICQIFHMPFLLRSVLLTYLIIHKYIIYPFPWSMVNCID